MHAKWLPSHQTPLSIGFSRQEHWSGLPCPSAVNLPDPRIKSVSLMFPALADGVFTTSATWKPDEPPPTLNPLLYTSIQISNWFSGEPCVAQSAKMDLSPSFFSPFTHWHWSFVSRGCWRDSTEDSYTAPSSRIRERHSKVSSWITKQSHNVTTTNNWKVGVELGGWFKLGLSGSGRASEKLLGAIMWGHRAIAIDLYCCLLQNENEHSQVV